MSIAHGISSSFGDGVVGINIIKSLRLIMADEHGDFTEKVVSILDYSSRMRRAQSEGGGSGGAKPSPTEGGEPGRPRPARQRDGAADGLSRERARRRQQRVERWKAKALARRRR